MEKDDDMTDVCSSSSAAVVEGPPVGEAGKVVGRHWVTGVGYRPGPAPEAPEAAECTRASGRVRRESNKYASDDEEDVSRPKKRKKKAAKKECVAAGEAAKKKAKGSSKKKGKAARVCHMTVSTEGAGAAVTLTSRDAAMTSQRRLRTALADAEYDMELVPDAARDLEGSFLERVEGTAAWERRICEIMLLCNEAAWRRVSRERSRPGPGKGAKIPTSNRS